MAQNPVNVQDILNRIAALEEAQAAPEEVDYSDPQLYLLDENNEPIEPESLEKIPDVVKDLPEFRGNPNEISTWLNDAESLIKLYQPTPLSSIEQRNKFYIICRAIRRKVKGEANDALVASNVNINFHQIKRTLETYFGEKRDIGTLDYQLMNSFQRGRSLEDYYDEINRLLSLIANQIRTDRRFRHPEAARAMIEIFNDKALDAFVRGLDGDLGKFLKNYRPDSLASAYAYCISFQNIEFRKNLMRPTRLYEVSQGPRNLIPLPPRPRIPNMQHQPRIPMRPPPQVPFRQFNQFNQHNQHHQNNQQFHQPRQFRQEFNRNNLPMALQSQPLPQMRNPFVPQRPEPMEVDQSIRSRQINYANRPHQNYQPPQKRPRMFNIEDMPQEQENNIINQAEQNLEQPPERYIRNIENQEIQEDFAEFNFLE